MAKRTLNSILQCPIDFLYLWASDEFISQLGSKAKIVRTKKYNQYQTLWKTMVENVSASNRVEYEETYKQWLKQIQNAIEATYGVSPETILEKLAIGEEVLGKNWKQGIYGIGEVRSTFAQNSSVTVDATTGMISVSGVVADGQVPIIGNDGAITGYSYYDRNANRQYQSGVNAAGQYGAVCYSSPDGVESATGGNFDPTQGSFWQNANNYMPLVNKIIEWIMSLVGSFTGNRVVLTQENTVPEQTEWVESESNNGGLIAGGLALAGIALITMDKPKVRKRKNNKK